MDPAQPAQLDSLFDIIMSGGALMIPIGMCSIVALAYIVERSIRLTSGRLGDTTFAEQLVQAIEAGGASKGLALCEEKQTSTARILAAGLKRPDWPWLEREKAVEDAGGREVQRLSANLRPLVVIGMIAPLLGLLGTVWGMIDAFQSIALEEGLGSPEALASGISQALVTTAAGLAVAIPTQSAYYFFRSRIDRFVRNTEDLHAEIADLIHGPSVGAAA